MSPLLDEYIFEARRSSEHSVRKIGCAEMSDWAR